MGNHANITADAFPRQSSRLRDIVRVIFHRQGDAECRGVIVRDDEEAPDRTLIRLDDGRTVDSSECQWAPCGDGKLRVGALTAEEEDDFRGIVRGEGRPTSLTVERLLAVIDELVTEVTTATLERRQASPPWLSVPKPIADAIEAFGHECECQGNGQLCDVFAARCRLDSAIMEASLTLPVAAAAADENRLAGLARRMERGGAIVSTDRLSAFEIAAARAADRMVVTSDGYGYVYLPAVAS